MFVMMACYMKQPWNMKVDCICLVVLVKKVVAFVRFAVLWILVKVNKECLAFFSLVFF